MVRKRQTLNFNRTLRRARSGFTLVEVLIVIAIIALVVAILLPVFSSVRERARMVACQSNLRQIGMAVLAYSRDHDDIMPPWGATFAPGEYLPWALDPYIKVLNPTNPEPGSIWVCPTRAAYSAGTVTGTGAPNVYYSYGYNYLVLGNSTTSTQPYLSRYDSPAPLAGLADPAQTVEFMDSTVLVRPPYGVESYGYPDTVGCWHQARGCVLSTNGWITPSSNANARVNILWGDGHVKALSRGALTPPSRGGSACNDDLWDRVKPSPYKIAGCT